MQFQLRVRGVAGSAKAQQIGIEASSEADAIRLAVKHGWQVLAVASPSSAAAESTAFAQKFPQKFPLLQFSQELLALLEAGLNLSEAITTLHAKESNPAVKATLHGVLTSLQQGLSLSETMAALPSVFPDIYVATVRAAERSGNLPEALARFVAYQLQFDAIKKKLVSAAIYPVMLLVVGGLVTLFLLGYVVPKFSVVYETSGREIPWMSQVMLRFGKVIYQNGTAFLIGFACVIAILIYGAMDATIRQRLLATLLRIPFLSAKAAEFRLARFYRALSLLLHAGIPLSKGLAMVAGMLTDTQQEALRTARRAVEEGQPFSVALEKNQLATPVAKSLLKVGENTGRLGDMLERSAKFHDEDFARWVDWASRLLEPMLMTILGVVIGAVVVLMYMPIFELAGSLS